jgi:hypothetical protein
MDPTTGLLLQPASAMAIGAAGVFNGFVSFHNANKQREQSVQLALFNALERRHEIEVSRQLRLEELLLKMRNEEKSQERREEWEYVKSHYPLSTRPGELATAMIRMNGNDAVCPKPVVIFESPVVDATSPWRSLCVEAMATLRSAESNQWFHAVRAVRPVYWPRCSHLIDYDLVGRPAVVIAADLGNDCLHLSAGAYNLVIPYEGDSVADMATICSFEYRQSAELEKYDFYKSYDPESGEMVLTPHTRAGTTNVNPYQHQRDYVRLCVAAITLLVARFIDHYYLANRYAYVPRFARLLQSFQAKEKTLSGPAIVSMQDIPDFDERLVLDVPYYRLIRQAPAAGDGQQIITALCTSLASYGGVDYARDLASVIALLRSYSPPSLESAATLREAIGRLEKLPPSIQGRQELLSAAQLAAARAGKVVSTSDGKPTGPKPRWTYRELL